MKKIIIFSLVALSTIFDLTAQSQTDLRVTLVNPKPMSTIYNQTPFNVEVNVQNMGKYHVTPNDTMYFFFFIDTNWITSGGNYFIKMITDKAIPSGGNLTFTVIPSFSLTLGGLKGLHEFGTYLFAERDTTIATRKNNYSSNKVYFSQWGLSVNPSTLSKGMVHPNPTDGGFYLNLTGSNPEYVIYGQNGQLITKGNGTGTVYLPTHDWSEGLYQIRITNGNTLKTETVVISR